MKITKYQHACFTVEHEGKLLVVDPGTFTTDLGSPENIVAIVVTHEHGDHFDPNALGAIIAHNPEAIILGPEAVTRQFGDTLPSQTVSAGESIDIVPFHLEFFGGDHAVIHPSKPIVANLGVMINELVYYPGDSFVEPAKPVDTLALPAAAPWLKISEAIDYLTVVKPRFVFPTHDAILSEGGQAMIDGMLRETADNLGTQYRRLGNQPFELQ